VQSRITARFAFVALIGGAVGIAFAPIFVRYSGVGPSATAFYRLGLALPLFWLWLMREAVPRPESSGLEPVGRGRLWLALPGLFFAGDLALWHWSIRFTSVANATLFANLAPLVVTVAARLLFGERISVGFVLGLALAMGGAVMVVGSSLKLAPGQLLGDLLGIATAVFYAGYMLSVKDLRRRCSTVRVMTWTALSACPVLVVAAVLSGERLVPTTAAGWWPLVALALVSQILGQGLIAFALAHLSASFSSVSLLAQPVVAAVLAWLIIGEDLGPLQALGGLVVLLGIALAARAQGPARGAGNSARWSGHSPSECSRGGTGHPRSGGPYVAPP
jgi:drug/metabolite transporter (DMT)-like permease